MGQSSHGEPEQPSLPIMMRLAASHSLKHPCVFLAGMACSCATLPAVLASIDILLARVSRVTFATRGMCTDSLQPLHVLTRSRSRSLRGGITCTQVGPRVQPSGWQHRGDGRGGGGWGRQEEEEIKSDHHVKGRGAQGPHLDSPTCGECDRHGRALTPHAIAQYPQSSWLVCLYSTRDLLARTRV